MTTEALAPHPDEPVSGWAVLVLPGLGLLMAVVGLDFLIATDPFWVRLLPQVTPRPALDWRYLSVWFFTKLALCAPLLVAASGLVWLTQWVPLLHPIAEHVRRDWSLLSFVVYGAAGLPLVVAGDEYRGLGEYQLASLACLAAGALAYMRPARPWPRLGGLWAALGLAGGLLALGLYQLYPDQVWAAQTPFPRWHAAIGPFISALALGVLMLAPAARELLPHRPSSP